MTPERLREIEKRVARVEALRATARDLLTAVNENNDTRTLHALLDDLVDLLNPPTEEYEPCCRYCGEPGSDHHYPCC